MRRRSTGQHATGQHTRYTHAVQQPQYDSDIHSPSASSTPLGGIARGGGRRLFACGVTCADAIRFRGWVGGGGRGAAQPGYGTPLSAIPAYSLQLYCSEALTGQVIPGIRRDHENRFVPPARSSTVRRTGRDPYRSRAGGLAVSYHISS